MSQPFDDVIIDEIMFGEPPEHLPEDAPRGPGYIGHVAVEEVDDV